MTTQMLYPVFPSVFTCNCSNFLSVRRVCPSASSRENWESGLERLITLRALVEKGLVKANNFRRNDNKLAYAYLLTPCGCSRKIRMTRDYLRRKEVEYEVILAEIDALRSELRSPSTRMSSALNSRSGAESNWMKHLPRLWAHFNS